MSRGNFSINFSNIPVCMLEHINRTIQQKLLENGVRWEDGENYKQIYSWQYIYVRENLDMTVVNNKIINANNYHVIEDFGSIMELLEEDIECKIDGYDIVCSKDYVTIDEVSVNWDTLNKILKLKAKIDASN